MSKIEIYHNPRCRKSREALEYLNKKKKEPIIRLYLEEGLKKTQIKELVSLLDVDIESIIRKEEKDYKEHFKGKKMTKAQWVDALSKYPKLLQRPIVVKGKKAVVGRPLENVEKFIK